MPAKRKQASGTRKMRQLGRKPSQLWLTPELYDLIQAAAKADGRSMANFIKHATVRSAQELLKAHGVTLPLVTPAQAEADAGPASTS